MRDFGRSVVDTRLRNPPADSVGKHLDGHRRRGTVFGPLDLEVYIAGSEGDFRRRIITIGDRGDPVQTGAPADHNQAVGIASRQAKSLE